MLAKIEEKLYFKCTVCEKEDFRFDHLSIDAVVKWTCEKCGNELNILRLGEKEVDVVPTGRSQTPVTVTLVSETSPPIEFKLNTWKYAHSQNLSREEYESHETYFYNEHTCPTNWVSLIEQIKVGEDTDPHGLFRFVSVEDGHFKNPSVLYSSYEEGTSKA